MWSEGARRLSACRRRWDYCYANCERTVLHARPLQPNCRLLLLLFIPPESRIVVTGLVQSPLLPIGSLRNAATTMRGAAFRDAKSGCLSPSTLDTLSIKDRRFVRTPRMTAELSDLARVGDLNDACAGLASSLRQSRAGVWVLMPAYAGLLEARPPITEADALPGWARLLRCRVDFATLDNRVVLYSLGCPTLGDRSGMPCTSCEGQIWPDDHLRWTGVSLAAAEITGGCGATGWRPDIVHCNDWPTRLVPAYRHRGVVSVPSIMTSHKFADQDPFPASLQGGNGIPAAAVHINGIERGAIG